MTLSQNNNNSNNKTTSQRIIEYRQRHNLSQAALAELVGCNVLTIRTWEIPESRWDAPYVQENQMFLTEHRRKRRSVKAPSKVRMKMLRLLEEDAKHINVNTALVYRLAHLEKEVYDLKQRLAHLEREAQSRGWTFLHSPYVHTPEGKQWNEHLFHRVELLELSVRSAISLQNASIDYIYQLVQKTDQDLLKCKHLGKKSLREIKTVLAEKNLSLGMTIKDFPVNLVLQRQWGGSQ